jgi:sialic acid synthase SpsE
MIIKKRKIRVEGKYIGEGEPIFIIAEAGNNHGGDYKLARKMVRAAATMGADAIKFQCLYTKYFVVNDHPYYDTYKRLEFTKRQWMELFNLAKRNKLIMIVDVNDEKSVDVMDEIDVPMFKIHCGDLTNPFLLKYIAKKDKPMILHTGLSTKEEIKNSIQIIKSTGNDEVIPMHGFQDYPTKMEQLNLNILKNFKQKLSPIVGFADHTSGILAPIVAVGIGVNVIEKHFTLNRKLKNYDWESSIEPKKFKMMVRNIKEAEKSLGHEKIVLTRNELEWQPLVRKYIVAKSDIDKGEIIEEGKLAFKRTSMGLLPIDFKKILGKKAKVKIKKDEMITLDKIER